MAIRQPTEDLYGELGVERSATRDEIAAAFRSRARELHPDAHPAGAADEERFKRVTRAYGVLSDPVQRARYDAGLLSVPRPATAPGPAPPSPSQSHPAARGRAAAKPGRVRFTRRAARWTVVVSIVLVLLGLAAGAWVITLQRADAALRARGVATTATVVDVKGEHRLQFTTRDGRTIRAVESTKSGEQQPGLGAQVAIHYDRADPTTIVTDAAHTGRDLTLWIVAAKLVIGGAVLLVFALRRLRRA
jgi:TRAP-type C4-dicarboxylate transport system permease small subunit